MPEPHLSNRDPYSSLDQPTPRILGTPSKYQARLDAGVDDDTYRVMFIGDSLTGYKVDYVNGESESHFAPVTEVSAHRYPGDGGTLVEDRVRTRIRALEANHDR